MVAVVGVAFETVCDVVAPFSVRSFPAPLRPQHRHADQAQPALVLHGLLPHRPLPRIRVSEGFTQLYDIPPEQMRTLLTNDTELIPFGFRFLKQVLFGENTIAMHQDTVTERVEIAKEKLQQLEAEARAKRAAEAAEM